MSSEAESSTVPLAEPTDARFSMRALLIAMAGVAALAALVGPIVRSLDPDAQIRLLVAWALWLAMAIAWIGILAHRRARVEKLAGQSLLRLPMFDERVSTASPLRRKLNVAAAIVMCCFMMLPISIFAVDPPGNRVLIRALISLIAMSFASMFWLGRSVTMLWWRHCVRFCENGILWDQQLVTWDRFLEHRRSEHDASVFMVRGIDHCGTDVLWHISVPEDATENVERLIDSRASRASIPPDLPMIDLSTAPLSIAARDPNFSTVVGRIVAIIAVMIAFMVLQSAYPKSDTFILAMMLGIFALVLLPNAWRFDIAHTGSTMVRLVGQRSWFAAIVFGAAALLCNYLGYTHAGMSTWQDVLLGFGFGAFFVLAIGYASSTQIDLRENGVVMRRNYNWPWSTIRVRRWDSAGTGKLVLQRGWWRVTAKVPPEQREAVDRALKEKQVR